MTVLWDDSFGPSAQPGDSTSGDFKIKDRNPKRTPLVQKVFI